MRIVVADAATVVGNGVTLDFLKEFGEVVVYDLTPPELLVERLQGADAVIVNKVQVTAQVMAACPTLKYVGRFATGFNNIDVAYAATHGVTVILGVAAVVQTRLIHIDTRTAVVVHSGVAEVGVFLAPELLRHTQRCYRVARKGIVDVCVCRAIGATSHILLDV